VSAEIIILLVLLAFTTGVAFWHGNDMYKLGVKHGMERAALDFHESDARAVHDRAVELLRDALGGGES
jgi:hypothetical protein